MGSTNFGTQTITLDFKASATSTLINSRFNNIRTRGIYKGGYLTKISDVSVSISPLVAEIGDADYQVRVSTAVAQAITVSTATPYIVLRWAYTGAISNYMDMLAVALGGVLANDLVIGKCTFSGSTLLGFDYGDIVPYIRRSQPNVKEQRLKVEPTETASMAVRIRSGIVNTGATYVIVPDQTTSTIVAPTGSNRWDLVYLTSTGTIQVQTGVEGAVHPSFAYRNVLALIYVTVGMTTITANDIWDCRDDFNLNNNILAKQVLVYYVRTDGSDSNAGFTNTPAGAKLTLQGALAAIPPLLDGDIGIYFADGTYNITGNTVIDKVAAHSSTTPTGGMIYLYGNAAAPTNVIFQGPGSVGWANIYIKGRSDVQIKDIKIVNTTLVKTGPSRLVLNTVDLSASWGDGQLLTLSEHSVLYAYYCTLNARCSDTYNGCFIIDKSKAQFYQCTMTDSLATLSTGIQVKNGGYIDWGGNGSNATYLKVAFAIGCAEASDSTCYDGGFGTINGDEATAGIIGWNYIGIKMANYSHLTYRYNQMTNTGNTYYTLIQTGSTYQDNGY